MKMLFDFVRNSAVAIKKLKIPWNLFDSRRSVFCTILLCAALSIVYSNSLHVPFYYDGLTCIVDNPLIRSFSSLFELSHFREYGLSEDIRNNMVTRFVTYVTFAINYRLHGYQVTGYHLINLFLHLVNVLMVYRLTRMTLDISRGEQGRSSFDGFVAWSAALLFAVHPVQTSAVTYVVQRFTLLATFLYLVGLFAYIRALIETSHTKHWLWYGTALCAALLAMFTKEISYTLPLMICLYDLAFFNAKIKERIRRLLPLLATMVILPAVVVYLATLSTNTGGQAVNALDLVKLSNQEVSRWEYIITQWRVIVTYLRLMLLPVGLNFDYDYPVYRTLGFEVLLSGLLIVVLATGGFRLLVNRYQGRVASPYLQLTGFGITWFFVTLVMESSFIRLDDIICEYRLYLPAVGFLMAFTGGVTWIDESGYLRVTSKRVLLPSIVIIAGILLSIATIERNKVWNDKLLFWSDTVRKSPEKARPINNLANEYVRQGRLSEALPLFERVKHLEPDIWISHYQLGQIYLALNRPAEAREELIVAVGQNNASFEVWRALGYANIYLGNLNEAENAFREWVSLRPGDVEAQNELENLRNKNDI